MAAERGLEGSLEFDISDHEDVRINVYLLLVIKIVV